MPGAIAETIGTPTRQPLSRQPNMKERHYDQYIRRQRNIQVTDGLKDINVMFSQHVGVRYLTPTYGPYRVTPTYAVHFKTLTELNPSMSSVRHKMLAACQRQTQNILCPER